jgi:hypothetical protein
VRFALILCLFCACAGTRTDKTTTTLNAIAMAVQPAYAVAMSSCVAKQQSVVVAANAGTISPDDAIVQFDAIGHRCHQTRAAFEVVKSLHDEAADLVESGKMEEAEEALRNLADAWQALKGRN